MLTLNQFIESELDKLGYTTVNQDAMSANQTDAKLSLEIRKLLLDAQESGKFPLIDNTKLPLVHFLAERGLFRCLDVIEDLYLNTYEQDKLGRNYFCFLVANKKYDIANQLLSRWERINEQNKFKGMISRCEIYLFGHLISGITCLNSDAMKILLEIVKTSTLHLDPKAAKVEAEFKSLYVLKQALKSANQKMKSKALTLAEGLRGWKDLFISLRDDPLVTGEPDLPILKRLSAEINELDELSCAMVTVDLQESLNETEEHRNKKALVHDCKKHFKTFMGDFYKRVDNFAPPATPRNLRYVR